MQIVPQRSEMLFDQAGVKPVVAGRNGCVSGEDHLAGNAGHGFVKAHTLVFHTAADRFQHRKSAVPFVHVKNARGDAHRFQSAKATDA